MKSKKIVCAFLAIAACACMASCSIKFGFVDDSSSEAPSSNVRSDNSMISEILEKGYSSTDMGDSYTLDGDFSMLELLGLSNIHAADWSSFSDEEQHDTALNLLNFWAYYGDDASIRYKPSELVSGITEILNTPEEDISALDAALNLSAPEQKEKYLAVIGVIDIDAAVGEENTGSGEE